MASPALNAQGYHAMVIEDDADTALTCRIFLSSTGSK